MKSVVLLSCLFVWFLAISQHLGAEQLYGHDILLDEHTVLFTEGSKAEIEEEGGRRWAQRFPFIHIEDSDTCELLGSVPTCFNSRIGVHTDMTFSYLEYFTREVR